MANDADDKKTWEVALCVDLYLPDEELLAENGESADDYVDDAFEMCGEAIDDARDSFREDAAEAGVNVEEILSIEFTEFDSRNINHACGYFTVTYRGDAFPEDEDGDMTTARRSDNQ